jgi:hypothetical protein
MATSAFCRPHFALVLFGACPKARIAWQVLLGSLRWRVMVSVSKFRGKRIRLGFVQERRTPLGFAAIPTL